MFAHPAKNGETAVSRSAPLAHTPDRFKDLRVPVKFGKCSAGASMHEGTAGVTFKGELCVEK